MACRSKEFFYCLVKLSLCLNIFLPQFHFIAYIWHSVKRVLSDHPLLSDHLPHSSLDFYFSLSLFPSFFPFLASFFSLAGYLVGFILVGRFLGKLLESQD